MAHATKVLAIFLLALAGSLPAHAELKPSQMELAKLAINAGGFPLPTLEGVELDCPEVELPASDSEVSLHLLTMRYQYTRMKECIAPILAATTQNKLRNTIEELYPSATGSQTSTLLGVLTDYLEPVRTANQEKLSSVLEHIQMLERPEALMPQIVNDLDEEAANCDVPQYQAWQSVAQARQYLRSYSKYEGCIEEAARKVKKVHAYHYVHSHFASESERTRKDLLIQFTSIKGTASNTQRRIRFFTKYRQDTIAYIREHE